MYLTNNVHSTAQLNAEAIGHMRALDDEVEYLEDLMDSDFEKVVA